jgi:hypothetical protein
MLPLNQVHAMFHDKGQPLVFDGSNLFSIQTTGLLPRQEGTFINQAPSGLSRADLIVLKSFENQIFAYYSWLRTDNPLLMRYSSGEDRWISLPQRLSDILRPSEATGYTIPLPDINLRDIDTSVITTISDYAWWAARNDNSFYGDYDVFLVERQVVDTERTPLRQWSGMDRILRKEGIQGCIICPISGKIVWYMRGMLGVGQWM